MTIEEVLEMAAGTARKLLEAYPNIDISNKPLIIRTLLGMGTDLRSHPEIRKELWVRGHSAAEIDAVTQQRGGTLSLPYAFDDVRRAAEFERHLGRLESDALAFNQRREKVGHDRAA
jgi:hypothetical protein